MNSIQLSHEEFLLLLGLLHLPMPLALGEDPTAGYTEETLNAALLSAMSSLVARGYLKTLPSEGTAPALDPDVQALLSASALAESCMMVAVQQGDLSRSMHYSRRGDQVVAHTGPQAGVHRLTALNDPYEISDQLLADIVPLPMHNPQSFTVNAEALGRAVDAASIGQLAAATSALVTAGVAAEQADSFAHQLGQSPTRYALVIVRNLQSAQPSAESAVVLQGLEGLWYAQEVPQRSDDVVIGAISADTLRGRLGELINRM